VGSELNSQLKCHKMLPTGCGERVGSGVGSAVQDVSDANDGRYWRYLKHSQWTASATLACAALHTAGSPGFGSDVDDVDSTCSRELDKVTAVAGDARTCAAQGTFHDAGVDDAVCRDGQQNAGSPGGFFAEDLHVTALDELA